MARLGARERASLPDSAFAYIDSSGRRRLPIHDEAHVRNALGRFDRVAFESEEARERARRRLLNAAKKFGIVPVGFIDGQLRSERRLASGTDASRLPGGFVTFLLTDIEGSTALLTRMGDGYGKLLNDVRGIVRRAVVQGGGHEVDARADEFFAVFKEAVPAVEAAVEVQRTLDGRTWPGDMVCRVRIGLHSGRATVSEGAYIGLSVHTAARVCSAANGGQIVVSGDTRTVVIGSLQGGTRLRSLGRHRLAGLSHAVPLYQVQAAGLQADFPPLRTAVPSSTDSRG